MNKELIRRLKNASKYQKMAIKELFPAETNAHLEVIERELKAMVTETAVKWMSEFKADDEVSEPSEERVKKVEID
ncbi:MAG: hypothetical protein J5626_11240 [Lachnospiraceae bacterium]|nr:hypothetical protein [Lachnospiraceae bacterium]